MSNTTFFTIMEFTSQWIFKLSACMFVLYVCYLVTLDFVKSLKGRCVSRWIKRRCKIAKHDGECCKGRNYYSVDFYPLQYSNALVSMQNLYKFLDGQKTIHSISLNKYQIKELLEDLEKAQQTHYSTVVKTPTGYARLFFQNDALLKEFLDKNTNN